ncbi:hypothetical protein FAY30_02105 [Bacillus sp. S3]|uniref:hypothetical protein n=1 Tax=Bacillus sp. S3 TaxID=486398 RepID=UPI00118D3701|nr:hypothetical protein [Bacillus sp. S3]QCJ40795.1 hypothetical protein FAY30_02105 [Bacillus sp. S3]
MNQKSLWLSSLIISLGIIIGCSLIAFKALPASTEPINKDAVEGSVMLDLEGVSKFLGFSSEELKMIIASEKKDLEINGGFEGVMLPYITVEGNLYFEKTKLLLWAQQNAELRKEY